MTPATRTAAALALCIAAAVAAPAAAHGETLALLPFSGLNVHPAILEAAQEVLKDHLQRNGRFTVVTIPGPAGAAEATPAEALAQARAAGATLAVVVRIVHLGSAARVRLSAYSTASGGVTYWDSMQAAGTPGDLDPALARLAAGLATGRSARGTGDIDTVTQREAEPLRKLQSTRTFGVRLGTMLAANRPGGAAGTLAGIGIFWLYDARAYLADIGLDYFSGDAGSAFNVAIGAYYPFGRETLTPYVGGGLAWSAAHYGGAGKSGIVLHGSAGLIFGRLSNVQLRGEVGYFVDTFAESETTTDYSMPVGTRAHYSHGPKLSLGIGF